MRSLRFLLLHAGVFLLSISSSAAMLCESVVETSCRPLSSAEQTKKDLCEVEMKANNCEAWFEKHPGAALKGRRCDVMASCPAPTKLKEYATACMKATWDGVVDFEVGILDFILGNSSMPPDLKKREDYFKQCTSIDCKYKMLGPYADLFTREEIQGHANTNNLDPKDIANQNYLQGLSAKTLYTKLLEKLRVRAKDKNTSDEFIEPWSGDPAAMPKTIDEMIADALADAGVYNTACYDPVVLAEMRCHALGVVLIPLGAAARTASIARLAGVSDVDRTESLAAIRKRKSKPFQRISRRDKVKADKLDALDRSRMRAPAVDAEELSESVKGIWDDDKLNYEQKMQATFNKYSELRKKNMNYDEAAFADKVLKDIHLGENPNNAEWAFQKRKIMIGKNLREESIIKNAYIAHELEHLTQHGAINPEVVFAKSYQEMIEKNLKVPRTPVSRMQAEFEAIGSQWDFLQAVPADVRAQALKRIEENPRIPDKLKTTLTADIKHASLSREEYVKQVPITHGYSNFYDASVADDRFIRNAWLGIAVIGGGATAGGILYKK